MYGLCSKSIGRMNLHPFQVRSHRFRSGQFLAARLKSLWGGGVCEHATTEGFFLFLKPVNRH